MIMLKSDSFFDFAGFEAFYADPDLFGRAFNYGPDALKIRHKTPYIDAGDL